ncbi:MAG TPA: hypothetical protein QF564_00665 [Pirellulaceae bacterium]|nr:hypothetical protein [Pirellulaceae bacterium]
MKAWTRPLNLFMALLVPSILLIAASSAAAVEPAREFLAALRERKYFDEALQYLDQIAKNPAVPIELKESLLYEKGVTLVEASREQGDPGLREKALNDAQQLLNQFVGQRPDHAKANAARSQLGNLIVERARMKVEDAKKTDNKQKLLAEASRLYEEGFQVFKALQESVKAQLDPIPKVLDKRDKQQAKMAELRLQLRADYLQTLLLAAAIREESADAVPAKDPKHAELLNDAATQYADIYTKYRSRLAGLYARMYQGRCNQKLGKFRDALGYFSELLDQPDEPEAFRKLKTLTMKLAMECWLHESEKKFMEAIKRGSSWIAKSRPTEDREPDWLYLRYVLAKAYQMQAVDASVKGETATANRSRSDARKLAQFVSRFTSDYQKDAQQLVAELGGPDRTGEKVIPTTFAEAKNAGKEALDSIPPATLVVTKIPARIAAEKDATVKAELQKQLDAAKQTLATAQDDAMGYFRDALRLADDDTSNEEITVVRYFLCYLYYTRKDFFDAGLMGEFISHRYPGSAGARPCAQIALASYLTLYDENQSEDKSFEISRIVSIAEYTVAKWPDQPEAADALNTLIRFAIDAGELDRAEDFLAKLPTSSSKLGDAQLKLGQAIWRECLETSREIQQAEKDGAPAGSDPAAQRAKLKTMQAKAREVLAAGFASSKNGDKINGTLLLAALSLAQVYVEAQTPEDAALAIAVLEDTKAGPLTLVRAGHDAAKSPGYVQETFKTALRAYILALGSTGDADATIANAEQVMAELKTAMGETPEGKARLINVYVGLASDLDARMAVASDDAKESLSRGFEAFLQQLSNDATELNVMNWVAETYDRLGRGFDTQQALSQTANRYYGEAAKAFANIVNLPGVTPELKVQVRIRQAQIKGRQRQFKAAIDLYEELLIESPVMLNVQVNAAKAYQDWAAMPNKATLYERALLGARKSEETNKNVIWGWRKIGDTTSRYPKFKDVFHEARYNQAVCRLNFATSKQGADRTKWLNLAETEIKLLMRLYPELGGDKWTAKYDDVLKNIQTAKGDQPLGLKKYKADVAAKAGG